MVSFLTMENFHWSALWPWKKISLPVILHYITGMILVPNKCWRVYTEKEFSPENIRWYSIYRYPIYYCLANVQLKFFDFWEILDTLAKIRTSLTRLSIVWQKIWTCPEMFNLSVSNYWRLANVQMKIVENSCLFCLFFGWAGKCINRMQWMCDNKRVWHPRSINWVRGFESAQNVLISLMDLAFDFFLRLRVRTLTWEN